MIDYLDTWLVSEINRNIASIIILIIFIIDLVLLLVARKLSGEIDERTISFKNGSIEIMFLSMILYFLVVSFGGIINHIRFLVIIGMIISFTCGVIYYFIRLIKERFI